MEIKVDFWGSLADLSLAAAKHLARLAVDAVEKRGKFSLVLAGGSTPKKLYEILASDFCNEIPWQHVHVFWGDERLVPPENPDSNFKMAQDALLSKVPIPKENIHPMALHPRSPDEAAAIYQEQLERFFGGAEPSFDLVLLGMGEDGHTASLFPGDAALDEREKWVAGVIAPDYRPPPARITLTLPLISQARAVFFLVAGESKRAVVKAILGNSEVASAYPAAYVGASELLCWYLDAAAHG